MNLQTTSSVVREKFGELPDGTVIERISLRTADGFEARVITYGAALQALLVPDRHGVAADVVLGFDDGAAYAMPRRYSAPPSAATPTASPAQASHWTTGILTLPPTSRRMPCTAALTDSAARSGP